jgi:1-acyl-sn-glycerol-3-phosphate acyltransferase
MIVLRFLHTVFGWLWIVADTMVSALLIGIFGESERSERVLRSWGRRFVRVTGSRVIARHHPAIEPGRSYVFVSNHTSNLDAPAILSVVEHPLRFIAKQELSYIPVFGWAARRMGHVFIDRKNNARSTRAIRERIGRGLRGESLFFFVEGTRSTTDSLLPFKKGAAVAALETGLDCVPIAVAGARDVLKPKGFSLFRPGPVAVVFGEPIRLDGHTMERRGELVAVQRAAVEAALEQARELVAAARRPITERAGSGT